MEEMNDALGVLHLKMWTKALAEIGLAMSRAISACYAYAQSSVHTVTVEEVCGAPGMAGMKPLKEIRLLLLPEVHVEGSL